MKTTNTAADDRATVIAFEETTLSSFSPEYKALKAAASAAAARLAAPSLTERVTAAYLMATGGKLNKYATLATVRAGLTDEDRAAVDAEMVAMQQRGEAVLYPIDDPQRVTAADNAAFLRVSGERRDLLCIR